MIKRYRSKTKCGSVKNPCKYCLGQVTNRNGLQCQGACKKWAHYKCVHYTPGKISDIKAGIIKVLCPCPDCETNHEKEYLTNPPYTCSNHKCPGNAKGPVKCDSNECPSNKSRGRQEMKCSTKTCPEDAVECASPTRMRHPRKPCPPRLPSPRCEPILKAFKSPCSAKRDKMPRGQRTVACSSSNSSCEEPCSNKNTIEYEDGEKNQNAMVNALHEMSGTVGMLSKQIKELMCKINNMMDNDGN